MEYQKLSQIREKCSISDSIDMIDIGEKAEYNLFVYFNFKKINLGSIYKSLKFI